MCDPRKFFKSRINPAVTPSPKASTSSSALSAADPQARRARLPGRRRPTPPALLPPPPQEILAAQDRFSEFTHRWSSSDTSLATVYRIYVAILCGRHLNLRNEVEYFWNRHRWSVAKIPEPNVSDNEQLAVLATIPYLLVKAFNRLIDLGLPRSAPPIMTDKLREKLKSKPKVLETVPRWAELAPPLERPLFIPDSRGQIPRNRQDSGIDIDMCRKNVLTFTLPVLFA